MLFIASCFPPASNTVPADNIFVGIIYVVISFVIIVI